MSKHSNRHIIEMSKSFALESIEGVHLFEYRLLNELPEDKAFGDKFFRDDIDFHCFLNQCRQLERAISLGTHGFPELCHSDGGLAPEIRSSLRRCSFEAQPYQI